MQVQLVSENTLIIYFGDVINEEIHHQVIAANNKILGQLSEYLLDCVPSYTSIQLTFKRTKISGQVLVKKIESVLVSPDVSSSGNTGEVLEIPVLYDESVAPDLDTVAQCCGLSVDEVIRLHSNQTYHVYAMGFSPGFAYMGILHQQLEMPRKENTCQVKAGSVAIAGLQTSVYPFDSPGGWYILGHTPLSLIDYSKAPFSLFEIGQSIRFKPIDKVTYLELSAGQV